jgi:hypothetical protein
MSALVFACLQALFLLVRARQIPSIARQLLKFDRDSFCVWRGFGSLILVLKPHNRPFARMGQNLDYSEPQGVKQRSFFLTYFFEFFEHSRLHPLMAATSADSIGG